MISFIPPNLIQADGTIDIDVLRNAIDEAVSERKLPRLEKLAVAVAEHNPGTFDGAYRLFEPMLSLLDTYDTYTRDPKLDSLVGDWADMLGLSKPEHLNAMLALKQSETRVIWLTNLGADPNAVLDPESPENLTIIGKICRVMWDEQYEEDAVREMVRVVLSRGDIPYSIAPRYEGDPAACDLFEAVMLKHDGSAKSASAVFEAIEECSKAGMLSLEAQHRIGRICAASGALAAYEDLHFHGNSAFLPLSFARFDDPSQWTTTFEKLGKHARADHLFYQSAENIGTRLIDSMTGDGASGDEVTVFVSDDRIPCTLLQAVSLCGYESGVRRLVEAGADPFRKVGAESEKHQIADLDAIGLWELEPNNPPSEIMPVLRARRAVVNAISQGKAAGAAPA